MADHLLWLWSKNRQATGCWWISVSIFLLNVLPVGTRIRDIFCKRLYENDRIYFNTGPCPICGLILPLTIEEIPCHTCGRDYCVDTLLIESGAASEAMERRRQSEDCGNLAAGDYSESADDDDIPF